MDIVRERRGCDAYTGASVYIDGRETAYRHAGRGRPVLILAGDDSTRRLAAALTVVARVILPERIEGDDATSTASWTRGLLDGLGIDRVTIVADEPHAMAAITLALADPFAVDRVALLVDGESVVAGVGIEERLESTGQRMLVLGRPDGSGAIDPAYGPAEDRPAWVGRLTRLLCAPD